MRRTKRGGHGFVYEIRKNRYLYLLALPGLLFLLLFAYMPMLGHLLAFQRYRLADGLFGSEWIGFQNFEFFFQGNDWLRVTWNTVFLNGLFLVFGLGTAVVLAILLNEVTGKWFKKTAQSFVFLPYFISWLVVSMMVQTMFSSTEGMMNQTLTALGFEGVDWYLSPGVWPYILTFVYVWKVAGYNSIIFLASITSISSEYYECAKMEGASRFQQIMYITLPLLRPIIIIMTLLGIGRIFYGDFGMIYAIIGDVGVLFPTTDVIDTYAYRALRQMGNFSMSSAIILYQSLMGLIAVVFFNWLTRKVDPDSRLF
ncbi:putative aldouronate transport system permease protein [Paenibacillus sp. cl6col]|uniref:ABC transporter permease subunit n=1 Tax=Paenibacillus alvei TaxID=44250 RepID=A0ABT4E557_PAEAL|nr:MULTISPECIES: ABC transporter permease subunit [Paenibacillus]EPY09727.1 binding-protein-dependent transport systems inner membrane component [Paenibacillus alvei A6-6i-x]MCY9528867.1 ABC transporter permease subunit [Paenibacillus alvei]SDG28186.1 putative aldouronate transport system permease protein [Paenibacillus sp. cl6col]